MDAFVAAVAGASVAAGSAVLAATRWRLDAVLRIRPDYPAMQPNTALEMLLLGIALWLARTENASRAARAATAALASIVALVSAVTLLEYAIGRSIGIDRLLPLPIPEAVGGGFPGRQALQTSVAMILLGSAMFARDLRRPSGLRLAEWLATGSLLIGASALAGYLFGAAALYGTVLGVYPPTGTAIHTSVLLVLLSAALIASRPSGPLASVFAAESPGARTARALAVVVLGAGGAAVAALAGERFGLYDRATALALPVVLGIGAAAVVVIRQSRYIDELVGALRSAADSQRDLVRHAADAIFVADLDGRYIEVNESACALLGYGEEELLGKTIVDLIPSADVARLAAARTSLLGGGEHLSEWSLRSRTGEWIPVELTARILPDGRWLAIVRDIRPRREAEERAARERTWLRAVIEQMPEGALLTDAAGRLVLENRALTSLARGYSGRSDLFGNRVRYDLRDPNGAPVPPERFPVARVLRGGETIEAQEYLAAQSDGRLVPISISASAVRASDGTLLGVVVLLRNLTTLKELERLREEWASLIAHDLRQPIAAIQITAEMLSASGERMTAEARAKAAMRIAGSASRLSRMADDLLDVSRLEAKRMTIRKQEMDLVPFLKETVERSASVTRGRPLELETSGPLSPFSADPARLEQILGNLLSNAVKYGEPGKPIRVRATGSPDRVEISVTNHGKGIAPEELPRLFDRFHRTGEAEASGVDGLGVGLYVCRGLVEAHGGSICAESRPGGTTTFRITFPRPQPAAEPASPARSVDTHAD